MDRRVPDSHYTALGLPLWARRTSWAEAELEQEVPVRGLGLQEDEWTSAVATGRRGLQRRSCCMSAFSILSNRVVLLGPCLARLYCNGWCMDPIAAQKDTEPMGKVQWFTVLQ